MLKIKSHQLQNNFMALLGTSIGLIVSSSSAQAVSLFFDDEATFLNNSSSVELESFEDSPLAPPATLSTITVEDFTINTDGGSLLLGTTDQPTNRFATDGNQFVTYNSNPVADPFTITFGDAITAFGLNITDLEQDLTITTNNGETTTLSAAGNASSVFFGLVSDSAFTSINFAIAGTNEGIGIDEVYYSDQSSDNGNTKVPEPSSLFALLLTLGLGKFASKQN